MKHSTLLFYLVSISGGSYLLYFLGHSIFLSPIFFNFIGHLCVDLISIFKIAPFTTIFSLLILSFALYTVNSFFKKTHSFFRTAQKIKQLPLDLKYNNFSFLNKLKEKHKKINVFSSFEPSAFCYFDTIFLSTGLFSSLNKDEIEAVFLHEYTHVSNSDSIRMWLLEVLDKCLRIPLFSSFIRDFKLSIEIEADSFVQETQGTNKYLKGALLKVIAYPNLHVNQFASGQLEDRIKALRNRTSTNHRISILSFLTLLSILSCIGLFSYQVKSALAKSEIAVHTDVNQCSSRSIIIEKALL